MALSYEVGDFPYPVIRSNDMSFKRLNTKYPAILGRPTRWEVTIDRPAKTLSNVALASKSVKIPGDKV
jgi:hypothetical protein